MRTVCEPCTKVTIATFVDKTSSGLRPDVGVFLLFGQKKVTKEKAAPVSRASHSLCCLLDLGGCGTRMTYICLRVLEGDSIISMAGPDPFQRAMASRRLLIDSVLCVWSFMRNEEFQALPAAPFDLDKGSPSEHRASARTTRR
jgi:hypothetical protein